MTVKGLVAVTAAGICAIVASAAPDTYIIKNARIVRVSGPIIERGSIVLENGVIADVGASVAGRPGATVIDARGMNVYPGLFDADTNIGLSEITLIRETIDTSEIGELNPQLLAFSAFHVESDHVAATRVTGVTDVLSRPSGATIPGQAAIMSLDGATLEQMAVRRQGAMMIEYPTLLTIDPPDGDRVRPRRTYAQLKQAHDRRRKDLVDLLARARTYASTQRATSAAAGEYVADRQLDALAAVVEGKQPVLIRADNHVDIRNAVQFAIEQKLNYVIVGARDAWRVADFLKQNNVRVILGPVLNPPLRADDPIDICYRTPAVLHEKGVVFALSSAGNLPGEARNLPFQAGTAAGRGLPYDAALRSVTLTPAELLGVADKIGSIDRGKRGNLVIAEGDLLDFSATIKHVFINGRPVSLQSKQTRLYDQYKKRP
jgi:imidazolonepropionase-like amidohydrolase